MAATEEAIKARISKLDTDIDQLSEKIDKKESDLQAGTGNEEYLKLLTETIPKLYTRLEALVQDRSALQERLLLQTENAQGGPAKRQRCFLDGPKQILGWGEGAQKFGGLQDRESAKEALYEGLEYLAKGRGVANLDKKKVPLLGISAPSGAGKTEFLRWIVDECCTFSSSSSSVANGTAKMVLERINRASPENVKDLDNLLVLFATFNQQSAYLAKEGPIVEKTIERLVRSYEGIARPGVFDAELKNWSDLVAMCSKEGNMTGFIVCIDELSKVRHVDESEYRTLMDSLLSFSQSTIEEGGYFAFVGSSLHIYDFGEVVLQGSGRAMRQIQFPSHSKDMEKKTRELVEKSWEAFASAESRRVASQFLLEVALQAARSSSRVSDWLKVVKTQTKVAVPDTEYVLPAEIKSDGVFELAARTALGQQKREPAERPLLDAVLDKLHGSAELHGEETDGVHLDWPNTSVTLSLPPWRLLQFTYTNQPQVFSCVQNWVLVELKRLFYHDGPNEAVKTWELATMGLLELRKAMMHLVRGLQGPAPSLGDIVGGEVGTFLKVSNLILETTATKETAAKSFAKLLPKGTERCETPCFHYAKNTNEEGVEGVFRGGFGDIAIFFQMKLYHTATPKEIKDWLVKAHNRAQDLGYAKNTYIVQLFVTVAVHGNVCNHYKDWPQNSMVFADCAIQHLFEPFGSGLFNELLKRRLREKQA